MAGGVQRRGGKKNRKWGRNGRKPGAGRQAQRTERNTIRRIRRDLERAARACEREFGERGVSPAQLRSYPGWDVEMKSGGFVIERSYVPLAVTS